jgi:hypothetical protein
MKAWGRRNPHRKAAPDVQILLTGQDNNLQMKLQLSLLSAANI